MKLLHHKAVEFHRIRTLKRHKKALKLKAKGVRASSLASAVVVCPEYIDLVDEKRRRCFTLFLKKLRLSVLLNNRTVINFTPLNKIESQAGLLLWAEICRLKDIFHNKRITAIAPRTPKIQQVFSQIGISKMFSLKVVEPRDHDVIYWRASTSSEVDGELYSKQLISPIEDKLPENLQGEMWRAVQEAMANIPEHAYIDKRRDGINATFEKKRWWMFSHIKNDHLMIHIADLGVGIPATISRRAHDNLKPHLSPIKRWLNMKPRKDSDVLYAVMKKTAQGYPERGETTLSRTGEPYRGRGLYDIMSLITHVDASSVAIMSNKGFWMKNSGQSGSYAQEYRDSIYGTLISWRVPLCQRRQSEIII